MRKRKEQLVCTSAWRVVLLAIIILCAATNGSAGIAYDLSSRPADSGIALGYDTDNPDLVCGIFRHEAKNGTVTIGDNDWLSPKGAGYFLGVKDRPYPFEVQGVVITGVKPGVYKKTNKTITVRDLYFRSIVQDDITIETIKEGKPDSYTSCFVKPISGRIGELTIDGKPEELSDNDLSDGVISTKTGDRFQVFFKAQFLLHNQTIFLLPEH